VNAPDYASPLVGWRAWRILDGEGVRLRSAVYDAVWEPGSPLEAVCRAPGSYEKHESPCDPCPHNPGCGIYSSTDVQKIRQYLLPNWKPEGAKMLFGLLNSWGTVVECSTGYRAQYAYPRCLFLPCDSHEYARELEDYGVPVECVGEQDRFLALLRVAREIEHGRGSPL